MWVSPSGQRAELTSATNGGCAKGMPRNMFTPSFDVPMNVPLSSVTMEGVSLDVGEARTVAVAAPRAKSFAQRKAMATRDND